MPIPVKLPNSVTSTTTVNSTSVHSSWQKLVSSYKRKTSPFIKALDAYLLFCILTGAAQLLYFASGGRYPRSSFYAGLISAAGSFVFTANVRLSFAEPGKDAIASVQIFGGYVVGMILLNICIAFLMI